MVTTQVAILPYIQDVKATEISWKHDRSGKDLGFALIANGTRYKLSNIGKTVFLTHEEAEAALKEHKQNDKLRTD